MTTDRSNKPQANKPAKAFDWNMKIAAHEVDFMDRSDELSAGSNCSDCSAISQLPASPRVPRHRRVEGR